LQIIDCVKLLTHSVSIFGDRFLANFSFASWDVYYPWYNKPLYMLFTY